MSDATDLLKSLGLIGGIGLLIGAIIGATIVVPFFGPTTPGGVAVLVAIPAIVGAVVGGTISAWLGSRVREG
jgi:hypothetical protein